MKYEFKRRGEVYLFETLLNKNLIKYNVEKKACGECGIHRGKYLVEVISDDIALTDELYVLASDD